MIGLDKLAAGEEAEVAAPEQAMNNDSTTITCLSDCTYAQNPEKTCMLKNITLSLNEKLSTFECGQYTPVAQEIPQEQQMQMPQPTGLDKTAPAEKAKPEQAATTGETGLAKVKPQA